MKAVFFLFIATFLLAGAAMAESRKTTCLNRKQVEEIEYEFDWDSANEKYDQWELCNSSSLTYKIFEAMIYMKRLRFDETPSSVLKLNTIGASPYSFFRSRVKRIVFESDKNVNCIPMKQNNVVKWAMYGFAEHKDKSMHICAAASDLSSLSMVQFFVHEARHLDSTHFNHVFCEQGHFATTKRYDCDRDFAQNGAYAIGVEFNRKMSMNKRISPVLRQSARNQSIIDLFIRFNRMPLGISSGAILQEHDGSISFFDGKSLGVIHHGDPKDRLARHWEWPFLFSDRAPYLRLLIPGDLATSPSKTSSYEARLNRIQKNTPIADILDFYNGPFYSCYLLQSRLLCTPKDGPVYQLALAGIKPVRLFSTSSSAIASTDQVFILDEKGILYEIPQNIAELEKTSENSLRTQSAPLAASRIDSWKENPNHWIQLTLTGDVGFASSKERQFIPIPLLKNRKFKDMYSPYYYSPRLRDL